MHTCICIYINVCMFMYACICMHVYVYVSVYMYVCMYVCMYMCVCIHVYVCMHNIWGELSGGKCPTQNGRRGNCPGNCPGEVSGGIVRGGIVLHPYFQLQCRLSSRFILQMLFKILPGRSLSVMNLILLCNMNSS